MVRCDAWFEKRGYTHGNCTCVRGLPELKRQRGGVWRSARGALATPAARPSTRRTRLLRRARRRAACEQGAPGARALSKGRDVRTAAEGAPAAQWTADALPRAEA